MSDECDRRISRDFQCRDGSKSAVHATGHEVNPMQESDAQASVQTDPKTPPVSRARAPPNVKHEYLLAKRAASTNGARAQLNF